MALLTLQSARAALESVRGTNLTPTRLLYFDEGSHDQAVATIRPAERRNSYFEGFRSYPGIERNTLRFAGAATFDDLIWYGNTHIKAVSSGTGAGADKTWTFVPTAATDDIKSATVQFGYADGIGATAPAWELGGCLGEELTLTWAKGSTLRYASSLMTAEGASQISAFTGSLSDRSTVDALGTATSVYIDASTIGSTADGDILEASWVLTNGWVYLDTLNGTNTAKELLRPRPRTWRLQLTRYYRNDTELDAYVAKTLRKIRLRSLGPALGGSNYSATLDVYGIPDAYEKAEADGIGVERLTLLPQYDTTATTDFSLTVVNATASIT